MLNLMAEESVLSRDDPNIGKGRAQFSFPWLYSCTPVPLDDIFACFEYQRTLPIAMSLVKKAWGRYLGVRRERLTGEAFCISSIAGPQSLLSVRG